MLSLQKLLPIIRGLPLNARALSVKFSENFDGQLAHPVKPKLRDFKYPLFHSFMLASSVYIGLNCWWYSLEYEQVEYKLLAEATELEENLQNALKEVKEEHDLNLSRKWFARLKFWN